MRIRIVAALSALVVVAGCGGSDDGDASTAPEPAMTGDAAATPESATETPMEEPSEEPAMTTEAPEPAATPEAAVPEALNFTATTVGGDTFDGAELAGTPTVFWFWAPWCPVCQGEADLIADLADQYEGQVSFVGVAGLSSDLDEIESFVADQGVDGFPHIDDRDGAVYTRFGVQQQYDLGVVNADGEVEILRGPLDESQITAAVDDLAAG